MSNTDGTARTVKLNVLNYSRETNLIVPTQNTSQTIGQVSGTPSATVDKTSVSPILKQTLTFTLSSTYTDTLLKKDLTV